ncbi:MAG TPA: SpoIIE family protein phosphatase [Ilumatobacteraceae bacterium]|nr:SpoIIE family protein phosphatase [Ilumatobacteraceae bacterium]
MTEPGSDQVRSEVLARAATALAAANDVMEVAEALIRVLCPAVADGCEIALQAQDGEVWRIASGPGEMTSRLRTRVPPADDHPLRRAVAGEFLVINADNDPQQRLFGPAAQPTSARGLGLRSAVIAPMASGTAIIGALGVAMGSSGRQFSTEDQELVRIVAQLTGRTIDNLQSAELQRRVTARLRTAGAIGALFAEAQQADDIAEILIRRGGEELGARSGMAYLLDQEMLRLVAYFGHPADRVERWRSVSTEAGTPLGDVMAGKLPSIWLESLDDVLSWYPSVGEVDGSAERSLAAVRLAHGRSIVGAVFWTFDVARRFNDADRGFVELIAEQAAAAIGRARATAEAARALQDLLEIEQGQRAIARTLQASLLPRTLPDIEGFELHVEYWPALTDMEVGGDFYDVFPIDDRRWGMVIGDVCGKGAAAAAVTGTARHSLRAAATHIRDETRVIQWVHEAIVAQADAPYITMAYAVLDSGDDATLRVVLAGHDRGIRIGADGEVRDLGEYGTLLGVIPPIVEVDSIAIAPGDLVVFHTDGVTDAPRGEALRRADLIDLIVGLRAGTLEEIGRGVRDALDARRPDGDRDDTALLLLRRL